MVSVLPGKDIGGFTQKASTNISRLNTVETAMAAFMAKNGRLPCPGGSYDAGNHNFGLESANPGQCTGGAPAAPMGPDTGTGFVVEGYIPTKTLGLDDSYALDDFGHPFGYVVDIRATVAAGANSCNALTSGGVQILKTKGGSVISNVMHAFISHGPDGEGAFPAQSATVAKRIWTGNTDADKLLNAGVDNTGTYNTTNFTNTLVRKEPTATFADTVYYAEYLKNNCNVGGVLWLTANQGGGSLQNGSTKTEYTNNSAAVCTGHTLTNKNGKGSCSTGSMSDCQYSICTPSGGASCSPNANQGGGSISSGGTRTEYVGQSDATCTAYTMTCTNGTLTCSTGGADLTDCAYSSCAQSCPLTANQGGGALASGNSLTTYVDTGDASCTTHTLLCTGTATTNTLTCDGSSTLTNCAYNSCLKTCGLTANQQGGALVGGGTAGASLNSGVQEYTYVAANDAACTQYTLTCTNGTLSCSTGGAVLTDCAYGACHQTCSPTANQGGGTMNNGDTRTPEYTSNNSSCTVHTMTCNSTATTNSFSCSTGSMTDCTYNSCATTKLSGTRMDGATASDGTGNSVAYGDVNGDGIRDLIIGVSNAGYNSLAGSGSVYVVYGTKSGFADPLPLSGLNGTTGFRVDGGTAGDKFGSAVAAGDINGDGYADIVIGAKGTGYNAVSGSGSVYIVYGGATGKMKDGTAWAATQLISAAKPIDGTNGFRLDGDFANENTGTAVAVGDVNGDGYKDIVMGAPLAGYNSLAHSGSVFVVFGGPTRKSGTAWAATQQLLTTCGTHGCTALVGGTDGFLLDGVVTLYEVGMSVATGDINGDGNADILIGAPYAGFNLSNSGSVYVVYGGSTMKNGTAWAATNSLTSTSGTVINATNGFRLDGGAASDYMGFAVAAGDVNSDGYADIVIGDNSAGYNSKVGSGSVYVVYGGASGKMRDGTAWAASQAISAAKPIDGSNGFRLDGATANDDLGTSVAVADINQDGYADIIMGATGAGYSAAHAGATYVVFGGASGKMVDGTAWAATQQVPSGSKPIDGTNGFRIDGQTTGDYSGAAVAAGDINGNVYPDITIGVPSAGYSNGAGSGSVYFVDGQSCSYAATQGLGTVVTAPAICSNAPTPASSVVTGATASGQLGTRMAIADVNGDGIPDLIVSAQSGGASSAGEVDVIFGTTSGLPDPLPIGSLNGTNGFRLYGGSANEAMGYSLGVADIDGDGAKDLIIGAYGAGYNALATSGSVYVIYGGTHMKDGTAWSTCPCTLTSGGSVINGTNGFRLDGDTAAYRFGGGMVAHGADLHGTDVDGDGKDDMIIGASAAGYTAANAGSVWVIYGGAAGKMKDGTAWAANQKVTAGSKPIDGANGFRLDAATASEALGNGSRMAVGDINGDGKADLLLGAYGAGYVSGAGSLYVIYGGASGKYIDGTAIGATHTLTGGVKPLDGSNGFRIDGDSSSDFFPGGITAGDWNGDGKDDIIAGAYQDDNGASNSGSVYVIYGGVTGKMKDGTAWAASQAINAAKPIDGTNGFRLDGPTVNELFGFAVDIADVNGDGHPDIIAFSQGAAFVSCCLGSTYVILGDGAGHFKDGTAIGTSKTLTAGVAPIDGTNGFRLDLPAGSGGSAWGLAAGDLNNDGKAEVVTGARLANSSSGRLYIYPGKASGWPSTYNLGNLCPGC
jgi:hypothetical protein